MSASNPAKTERPLSPHISVWRPTITYVMSIGHRITGGLLYFGTVLVAAWLIAAATGPETFDAVNAVYGSWFGLLVLFGYTWVLIHHALGGLRHFAWDMGQLDGKYTSRALAWATIVGSVCLTALIWLVGLFAI